MNAGHIPTYRLTVDIQDNGIIRDPFGSIIGRCDDEWLNRMTNRPPYGLVVSDDESVINWCGENYVRQKEDSKLTDYMPDDILKDCKERLDEVRNEQK